MNFNVIGNKKMNKLIAEDGAAASGNGLVTEDAQPAETKAAEQEPANGLVMDADPAEETSNGLMAGAPMDSEPSTQVAVRTQSTAVANPADVQAPTMGGEDVDVSELGYGAFKKLKIENAEFDLDNASAGKALIVAVVNRRLQRLIKPAGVENPTKEQMAYYTVQPGLSENEMQTTRGKSVTQFKQELREEGLKPEEVEYEMVGAQILKFSKEVGDVVPVGTMCEMQIAQASMQRFRGLMVMAKKQGTPIDQRVLKVSVGPKTQGGNGKTYNPWVIDPVAGTKDDFCQKLGINLETAAGISVEDLEDF